MLHETQVLPYYILTLTGTVPKAISKSVFYAPALQLRATASLLLSPHPRPRLPAAMVRRSTVIRTQASSKSCIVIVMNIANTYQTLC